MLIMILCPSILVQCLHLVINVSFLQSRVGAFQISSPLSNTVSEALCNPRLRVVWCRLLVLLLLMLMELGLSWATICWCRYNWATWIGVHQVCSTAVESEHSMKPFAGRSRSVLYIDCCFNLLAKRSSAIWACPQSSQQPFHHLGAAQHCYLLFL